MLYVWRTAHAVPALGVGAHGDEHSSRQPELGCRISLVGKALHAICRDAIIKSFN